MVKFSRLLAALTIWSSVMSLTLAKGSFGHDDDDDDDGGGGLGSGKGHGSFGVAEGWYWWQKWDANIYYTCDGGKNNETGFPAWNNSDNNGLFQLSQLVFTQAAHKFCDFIVGGNFTLFPGVTVQAKYESATPKNGSDCSTTADFQDFANTIGDIMRNLTSLGYNYGCCLMQHGSKGGSWRGYVMLAMGLTWPDMTCPPATVTPTEEGG